MRSRETSMCERCLPHTPNHGDRAHNPARVLTVHHTRALSARRPVLNPPSHTRQGYFSIFKQYLHKMEYSVAIKTGV